MSNAKFEVEYVCENCNLIFLARKRYDRKVRFCTIQCAGKAKIGNPAWNKGVPMRKETKKKLRDTFFKKSFSPWNKGIKMPSGPDSPSWRGGRYVGTDGYVFIYFPEHSRAGIRGYVREHILVAEKCLGRSLTDVEVVHHIDEDTSNNDPANLYIFENNGKHMAHHKFLKSGKEQPKVSNLIT